MSEESEDRSYPERRAAPRFQVNLASPVIIIAAKQAADGREQILPLQGRTKDISRSGVAIILSSREWRAVEEFGRESVMRFVLRLPSGAIELEATPVRFESLGEGERSEMLIGAQITNMTGRDRILWIGFLDECEQSQRGRA